MKPLTLDVDLVVQSMRDLYRESNEYFLDMESGRIVSVSRALLKALAERSGNVDDAVPAWEAPLIPVARATVVTGGRQFRSHSRGVRSARAQVDVGIRRDAARRQAARAVTAVVERPRILRALQANFERASRRAKPLAGFLPKKMGRKSRRLAGHAAHHSRPRENVRPPRGVNILVCPTAFKGTLSPSEAAALIVRGAWRRWPGAHISTLPLADGGDGTLDVLLQALKGRIVKTRVQGPMGQKTAASWALLAGEKTAVIEMARASGLALVKGRKKILHATSFGTGELIRAALDRGCREILLGVGGTACAEGGAGALEALGLRYVDDAGRPLSSRPVDLIRIARVDFSRLDPRLKKTKLRVLCDVTNPLLGARGSARVFGPQKGATPIQVNFLEKMLTRWSRFAPVKTARLPGAGAAGALAFGLSGFAGATLERGASFIMDAVGWKKKSRRADLLITGEGRLDKTSFDGKVLAGVLSRRASARVAVVCGSSALKKSEWSRRGIADVFTLKEFA